MQKITRICEWWTLQFWNCSQESKSVTEIEIGPLGAELWAKMWIFLFPYNETEWQVSWISWNVDRKVKSVKKFTKNDDVIHTISPDLFDKLLNKEYGFATYIMMTQQNLRTGWKFMNVCGIFVPKFLEPCLVILTELWYLTQVQLAYFSTWQKLREFLKVRKFTQSLDKNLNLYSLCLHNAGHIWRQWK